MRLSRLKRLALLGAALLTMALTGRAAAQEPPSPHTAAPAATPTARIAGPTAPKKAQPKHPTGRATTKIRATKHRTGPRHRTGPAGSRLTTGTRNVALTFDDGPDPVQTPRILRLLAQQHVHATFCLVGRNVRAHPAVVRQIVAGGHTLCNHSWRHSLTLGRQSAAKIRADLVLTNGAIQRAAPGAKITYFRAPGGNFTPRLVRVARQLGMTSIYWKVDPRDWDHPRGESHAAHRSRIIRGVQRHTRTGSIILSHDYAQPDTIVAYRTLLPWLRHRYHLAGLP